MWPLGRGPRSIQARVVRPAPIIWRRSPGPIRRDVRPWPGRRCGRTLMVRTRRRRRSVDTSPAAGLAATVHETHIGVVLLLGDRAYKIKKPVRTPFLDFSTRAQRLAALERELRLNRRLAPDVYLGLAHVSAVSPDGGPAGGDPAEHVLVMRRMPADRRLATLARSGARLDREIRALARLVAAFHASADRSPDIARGGGRDALRARWQ